jgi:hypothetical protein
MSEETLLLFRIVIIVLVYWGAPSSTVHATDTSFVPPPTHAVTSPSINSVSRDSTSLIITQCLGLPPLYPHPTIPLSAHYVLNLFYHAQIYAPFILWQQRTRRPVLLTFSCILILRVPRHSHLLTSVLKKALVSCMLTSEEPSLSLIYSLL